MEHEFRAGTMKGSAGDCMANQTDNPALQIEQSVRRLFSWLELHNYEAYDPFDGLNARFVRPLTCERPWLRIALQQGVRRFPLNLRPLLGIRPSRSAKAMGYIAKACIRLHQATGEPAWEAHARDILKWLIENQLPG